MMSVNLTRICVGMLVFQEWLRLNCVEDDEASSRTSTLMSDIYEFLCTDGVLIRRKPRGPAWAKMRCFSVISSLPCMLLVRCTRKQIHVCMPDSGALADAVHFQPHIKSTTWTHEALPGCSRPLSLPPAIWRPEAHSSALFPPRCKTLCVRVCVFETTHVCRGVKTTPDQKLQKCATLVFYVCAHLMLLIWTWQKKMLCDVHILFTSY